MSTSDYADDLRCVECNEKRPPGGELCLRCEDFRAVRRAPVESAAPVHNNPPHGNTTR
jgi:hypothetical protein